MHKLFSFKIHRWTSSPQLRIKDEPDLFSEAHRWICYFNGEKQMHRFSSTEDHSTSVSLTDEPGLFNVAQRLNCFTVWIDSHQWSSLFTVVHRRTIVLHPLRLTDEPFFPWSSQNHFFREAHRTIFSVKLTEGTCCPPSYLQTNLAFNWSLQMNNFNSIKLKWDSQKNQFFSQTHKRNKSISALFTDEPAILQSDESI